MGGDGDVAAGLKFYAYWMQRGFTPGQLDGLGPNERLLFELFCDGEAST